MSDDFLLDENSIQDARPREFYAIVQDSVTTYRIASGQQNIVYNGDTYLREPAARTDVGVVTSSADLVPVLALPLSHPLPQRWMYQGSPPRQVTCVVYRKMMNSGLVEQIFNGQLVQMSVDGHLARFQIQSRITRMLGRNVASFVAQKLCPHTLYDANCLISDAAFSASSSVIAFDGRTITVDGTDSLFDDELFAIGGDVLHVATNERQLVINETGKDINNHVIITLLAPMPCAIGDAIVVRAGCQHDISTCHNKFANLIHYGGFPEIPVNDLFVPGNSQGVYGS